MTATDIPAIGGGVMVRGAGGRFAGVLRDGVAAAGAGIRVIGGKVFRVTVLPDAPKPKWATRPRPMGKCQHGKRGGYREGSREKWAYRAANLAAATAEGVR